MRYAQQFFIAGALMLLALTAASAQTESDLKDYFEGRKVAVKLDLPATKDGVNVYPERERDVDYSRYAQLLKSYGTSVREGDRIMITKIKVKEKHIEFQLGGGGYGTFGDETSASIYVPSEGKSRREKHLERELKDETDQRRRRRLREELDELRRERRREDRRNQAEVAAAEELARQRIEKKQLQGGARFNIRFDRRVTERDLTPEAVIDALAKYVEFTED